MSSIKNFFLYREEVAATYARALRGRPGNLDLAHELELMKQLIYSEVGGKSRSLDRKARRWVLYAALNKAAFRGHVLGQELVLNHPNTASHWAATTRAPTRGSLTERQMVHEVDMGLRVWCRWPLTDKGLLHRCRRTLNVNDFIEPIQIKSHREEKLMARLKEQVPAARVETWLFSAPRWGWARPSFSAAYIYRRFLPIAIDGSQSFVAFSGNPIREYIPEGVLR